MVFRLLAQACDTFAVVFYHHTAGSFGYALRHYVKSVRLVGAVTEVARLCCGVVVLLRYCCGAD